jgi:hypothetical protein
LAAFYKYLQLFLLTLTNICQGWRLPARSLARDGASAAADCQVKRRSRPHWGVLVSLEVFGDYFVTLTDCSRPSRASVVFTSCEDGSILCWSLLTGGNSPIQRQNTSGYTITAITGYQAVDDPSESLRGHFLSIADTTGTIRLLSLPRHMHETR